MSSIYIPNVFADITSEKIKQIFTKNNIGKVSRVDFVRKSNDHLVNKAYVYIEHWYDSETSRAIQQDVFDGDTHMFKFHYSQKSPTKYWTLLKNNRKETRTDYTSAFQRSVALAQAAANAEAAEAAEAVETYIDHTAEFDIDEQTYVMPIPSDVSGEDDFSLVSADYVQMLENELFTLREQNNLWAANYRGLEGAYHNSYNSNQYLLQQIAYLQSGNQQLIMPMQDQQQLEEGEIAEPSI